METSGPGGPQPGPVVAGVDGSRYADVAALWAAAEAERRRAPLRLVHAADTDARRLYLPPDSVARARAEGHDLLRRTADLIAGRHPELPVATELRTGEPVAALLAAAGRGATLVVGGRGAGGLGWFGARLLGSVGPRLAAEAGGPVVVVREVGDVETGIVLAALRDRADLGAVRDAAREAKLRKASLRLMNVWHVFRRTDGAAGGPGTAGTVHARARRITAIADRVREEFPELTVTEEVDPGTSVAALLVDASRHADLVVMGGRRPESAFAPALGRTTQAVLHHAYCPVHLVPH
ncbi:universal stress protein [Streptomyces sp. NPDC002004]